MVAVAATPREVVVEKGAKEVVVVRSDCYSLLLESIHSCVHTPHCNTAAVAAD